MVDQYLDDVFLDQEVVDHKLTGVSVTRNNLGQGSHSCVLEVNYRGLHCVAKKFHRNGVVSVDVFSKTCYELCQLLGKLRHPNLVQFLGYFNENENLVPVIVFEHLYISLSKCMDVYGKVPEELQVSILKDVATGLRYLHERSSPIAARKSLAPSKVLLTPSMTAKLADIGEAGVIELDSRNGQCKLPGDSIVFTYEELVLKDDIFLFGLLMLHLLSGQSFITEVARYYKFSYFDLALKVESSSTLLADAHRKHPFFDVMKACLDINAIKRPRSSILLEKINSASVPPPLYCNSVEMLRKIKRDTEQRECLSEEIKKLSFQPVKKSHDNDDEREAGDIKQREHDIKKLQTLLSSVMAQNERLKAKLVKEIGSKVLDGMDDDDLNDTEAGNQGDCRHLNSIMELRQENIVWTKCPDMPVGMFQAQAVLIGQKIYVGGGDTGSFTQDATVYEYNMKTETWTALPPLLITHFGLCKLEGELISIGGKVGCTASASVYVFDSFSKRWKDSLPSLRQARYSPICASVSSAMIVSGGLSHANYILSSMEVLRSDTFQWYVAGYLSRSATLSYPSAVTIDDNMYILGGFGGVTASSCSNAVHAASTNSFVNFGGLVPYSWTSLPPTQHCQATAASIGPYLLSLGGTNTAYSLPVHDSIYGYCPVSKRWIYVGDLPYAFCHGSAVSLPNNEMFVMGGWVKPGKHKWSSAFYHGALKS